MEIEKTEKRNLYFRRSNGKMKRLGKDVSRDVAEQIIKDFIDQHNFKSYYWRLTFHDNCIVYDVGSWSEFFYWGEPDEE